MGDDKGQEKTEDPTPKRLRESRKKGQVPKSKDLTTVFILIVTCAVIGFFVNDIGGQLQEFMVTSLSLFGTGEKITTDMMTDRFSSGMDVAVRSLAPVMVAAFATALLVGFLQVGGLFSMDPLKPEIKKLNPIEGAKNMFKMKTFIELGKNIIKMAAIIFMGYIAIKKYFAPFLLTSTVPLHEGIKIAALIVGFFLLMTFTIFLFVAAADVALQKYEHKKNLKMTKDEVKREYKEDEGDPLIKGQRRQIHQEMAMGDVASAVKKADVVVTNPTHLAIAIEYNQAEMVAPQIVAKGQRLFAEQIREWAKEYDVPIMRNVPLAWGLIELEIGDEIPEELYQTVAEVLAFVYRLKAEKEHQEITAAQPRA